MNNGQVIKIMSGSKEEMRAQLDRLIEFEHSIHDERTEFFNQSRDDDTPLRPPSLCLLTEADIDHLLEHGYIRGVGIVLSTEFLINDDSVLLRPPLIILVAVLESVPSIEGGKTLLHTKIEDFYE